MVITGGGEARCGPAADLAGLTWSVGLRLPDEQLSCVGPALAPRRGTGCSPGRARPSCTRCRSSSAPCTAPSTPGDLHLHLRSRRLHPCFELARFVVERLTGAASVIDEVHGFRYFDARDLLGFVDGTENPVGPAAATAALIDDPADLFVGGSYVVVQKYLHDIQAWQARSIEEQERIIGRASWRTSRSMSWRGRLTRTSV